MARLDTESVVKLIINGEQAKTSLKEVTLAINANRAALADMKKEDDPKRYEERAAQLRTLVATQRAMREEIYFSGEASKGFFADWKKGFDGLKSMASSVTIGNLISDGISAAGSMIKDFIAGSEDAYKEAEKNQAQLDAALTSTQGVAGKTKDSLNDLATSLMDLTGVDDDLVTKSEEILLTFTSIRGSIYDKALPAILDYTSALNSGNVTSENLQASTIAIGKALNDPITGMTKLQKVGVVFTETQKEQITTMQKANNIMGAQQVILDELNKEFGGVAQTMANTESGTLLKFETRIGNLKEKLGAFLVSIKAAGATYFSPFLDWLEKITANNLSEKLDQDRAALSLVKLELESANTPFKKRVELIESLKKEYPEYLENVNADKISNEKLLPILDKINQSLVLRIAFQKKSEGLQQAMTDQADAFLRADKAGQNMLRTVAAIQEKFGNQGIKIVDVKGTDMDKAIAVVNQLKSLKNVAPGTNLNQTIKDLQLAIDYTGQYRDKEKQANAERERFLKDQQRFASANGLNDQGQDKAKQDYENRKAASATSGPSAADRKAAESAAKKIADEVKSILGEYDRLVDQSGKITTDELDKKLTDIENKYKSVIAKLKKIGKQAEAENLASLEGKEKELATQEAQKKFREDQKNAAGDYIKGIGNQIDNSFNSKQAGLSDEQNAELGGATTEDQRLAIKDKYQQKELEMELAHLQAMRDLQKSAGKDTTDLDKSIAEKRLGYTEIVFADQKKTAAKEKELQMARLELAGIVASGLSQIVTAVLGNSKAALAFQKGLAIAELAVNTATAIGAVTAQNAKTSITPIDYAIRVAAAVVTVIANIANAARILKSAETPALPGIQMPPGKKAKKGMSLIPDGPSHEEGGINLVNNKTGQTIAEMEGGEPIMILSKETRRNNGALIDQLLFNSMYKNGATVNTGGISKGIQLAKFGTILTPETVTDGTSKSTTPGNDPEKDLNMAMLEKMDKLIEAQLAANDKEVIFNDRVYDKYKAKKLSIKTNADA